MDASSAKETAAVAEAVKPANATVFHSARLATVGVLPIPESVVEDMIKEAWFDAEDADYVQNPALIKDVGERIVEELDLLARLMNPKTTYQPDWYDEHDDEQTPLNAVLGRTAFAEDYRSHLMEVYELAEEAADAIIDDIKEYIEGQETTISEYYG
jgi:hypothetical protein